MNTPSADDPIFVAWAGTDKKPAVQGYDPGVGADLYTTNGEQTDYAYARTASLRITPELGDGNQDSGFDFPDSEGEVQHEFRSTSTSRSPPRGRRPTRTTRCRRSTSRRSPST